MAAAAVDTALLASYSAVPEPQIQSLIDNPTTDLVTTFLQSLIVKAQDHDRLKSDRLRLDVELENAIRNGESRARSLKANHDKASQEIQELRAKLSAQETARSELEVQLQDLQTSTSKASTEAKTLEGQISKLEQSNRDTLSLLNAKSTSYDKLAEDLAGQQQKIISFRRDISALEERAQNAESGLSNAKFRESALQSEVDLLKRNNAWFESEIKTKGDEYSKSRKEKNARIAELQRSNEEARQTVETLQRTESTLRKRVEELTKKADDAFSKIQQMQEDAARTQEDFQAELDSGRRLADLQKQSADTARRRVQELEDELEKVKGDAANEVGQVQAELETERQERDVAEQTTERLEAEVERIKSELEASQRDAPGTPRARENGLGLLGTPGRLGSPSAFSPGSTRLRAGTTFTQLYAEHNTVKTELEKEKRINAELRKAVDDMLHQLEQKQPEVQEVELERDRLDAEVAQMSSMLDDVRHEKDNARKDARKFQSQLDGYERRAKMLEQQQRDLSAQVKILLVEVQIRDQGVQLSAAEREQLKEAAQLASDGATFEGMSDTSRFISERLVAFKDIFELQNKNMELTKIVRELGESREEEEAKAKLTNQSQEKAEVQNLKDRVERYKDEMKSLVTQSQSYIRERDMFRRMLSHRGQLPPDADMASMFGTSMNGAGSPQTPQMNRSTPDPNQTSKDISDYSKLLKELQSHFDAYRRESAADLTTVKGQVDNLAREKSQLQGEIARANSQVTLGQERYQMLQSNYDQLKSETSEFRRRYESLSENAARQDVRTQQVAEELVEAKTLAESVRNENSNLKAEKELWKRIEERLSEDNRALVEERTRLNKVLSDTQHLSNERELSDSENRRKLQYQVESLDTELKSVRQKLEEEVEANKAAAMRREFDQEQSRTRIDDLVKSLASVKEELVAAKTTRDQLQSQVDELKIELRTAEERTQALQPRPTPGAGSSSAQAPPSTNDEGLSREQELALEIADLKRDLDRSKADLENARGQVDQYKLISQSSEEELQSLNEALDQYKEDAEKIAGEKDSKIQDLEQRLKDIGSELETTNNQLSQLRASDAEHQAHLDQQRFILESEMNGLRDQCERHEATANMLQGDLKAQAELAQQAQQSYETELLKHAEAAKTLQKVRSELNDVKVEISQSKADAEAARTTLSQSEDSWASTKERYENELSEIKSRRDDIEAQNKLLHTQLESISAQIISLQQNRATSTGEPLEQSDYGSPSSGLHNLQEVIKYLRREKEIVDVQYELSLQETRRLKQQLDYSQSQLDEARLKIENERQRQADKEENSINHKKLMDTINELNVFRESSVTLRNEAREAQSQLAEKLKQVEELTAQIQPLQLTIREMENQQETTQGDLKLLEEDRDRWQQRTQNILQKYDRVDPAELEELKQKLAKLEGERDETVSEKQSLQERVDGFDDEIARQRDEARKELRDKLSQQFKTRSKEQAAQIHAEKTEKQALQAQLDSLKTELETTKSARDEAMAQVQTLTSNQPTQAAPKSTSSDTVMQNGAEEGQVEENAPISTSTAELENRLQSAEKRANDRLEELERAKAEASSLRERVASLQSQVNELEQKLNNSSSNDHTSIPTQNYPEGAKESGSIARLKEYLSPVENTLRSLRESLSALRDEPANANLVERIQSIIDQIDITQAKLQEAYILTSLGPSDNATAEEVSSQIAAIRAELGKHYQTRVENMKNQLSTKLSEGRASYREQMAKEKDLAIQEAETRLAERSKQTVEGLQKQLENLQKSGAQTQSSQTTPPTPSNVTSAPAATDNAFNEDSTLKVKVENTVPPDQWTMPQVRTFITNNTHVRGIVASNIKSKVEQETAKIKAQADKESDEKLEDARQKAEKAKENAVFIEGKKSALKLNMADRKARLLGARIEVVENAAKDTPQKPVVEVWAIAKAIQAPPASVQTSTQPTTGSPAPSVAPPGEPATEKSQSQPVQASSTPRLPPAPTEQNRPAPTPTEMPAASEQTPAQTVISSSAASDTQITPASTSQQQPQQQSEQNTSSEPKAAASQQPTGTGPAALRGLATQGSAIPRAGAAIRGAATRGGHAGATSNDQSQPPQRGGVASGIPRGGASRGSVRGRGQAGTTPQAGSTVRGGGAINPNARQFVPGNKRPREDSSGDQGNKRARGGGQGA